MDGVLKYCLRGLLGETQRKTFFHLMDILRKVCSDCQDCDTLPALEREINEVCAEIERDFPISVQVQTIESYTCYQQVMNDFMSLYTLAVCSCFWDLL